jgi:hypothetical protein
MVAEIQVLVNRFAGRTDRWDAGCHLLDVILIVVVPWLDVVFELAH